MMMRWTLTLMFAGLLGLATAGCEREQPEPDRPPAPTETEPASPPDDEPAPEPGS